MTEVIVGQKDGIDPRPKVEALAAGQTYPFTVKFTSKHKRGLVIPSSKHKDVIGKGESVEFVINSFQQLWDVVMDAAGAAETFRLDEIAAISVAPVKKLAVQEGAK